MILEELTLTNWRGYRDPHTFRFKQGFNLVVGRNEAGKSTLFEAMTRVLFDRHNSRAEEIRFIQPLGSSLSPEAELIFCLNGDRYKVCKRFLDQPVSKLYKERGGAWELDHEGDRADTELRSILQGEAAGRTTKPEHRGLAQALWYLQYEQPLPEKSWTESIKQGLTGLVQHVAESTDESRIFEAIEAVYREDFTPTGRVAARSELTQLAEGIQKDEQQLEELRSRSEHVEGLRSNLEELTARRSESGMGLSQAQSDLEKLSEELEAADALEEQIKQKEESARITEETLRRLSKDQNDIGRRLKEIDEGNRALGNALSESERLEADARQEQLAAIRHHKKWKEEHELKLQAGENDLRVLTALERLRRLTLDKERLQSHLSKVQNVEQELQTAKQNLASFHAPSEEQLHDFQASLSDLRVVEAQVETSAIRVSFQLDDANAVVKADPEAQRSTDGDELLVTAPTTFTIQGVGVFRVRGGGSSIEELNARAMELRANIYDTIQTYAAEGPQALSDLYQQRLDLEDQVKRLQDRLDELAEQEPEREPRQELARIEVGIREESKVSEAAPEEWKSWGGQMIREKISTLGTEKSRLIGLIKEEQSYEAKANDTHLDSLKKAQEASNVVSGLRSRIRSFEQENTEVLKTYGTAENLKGLVAQSEAQLRDSKKDLGSMMKDYEARVELPRRLHQQGMESVKNLEKQLGQISDDIVDRKARIEEAAAQGLYSQTADLEGALQSKKRRLETIQRRADAAKLLRDIIAGYRMQQSAALAVPVAKIVDNWLPLLTDDAYDALGLSEELLPISVHSRRYGEPLPLESLSYGTYEQVVVLVRLALGVLLSSDERNLVIIDDRLVNADSIRMKRLCLILEEVASKTCQVVVATCDDTSYSGIAGHIIRVPFDGKHS
jgi:DNA repair exonuclease SbcCD ATPase subunit